MFHLGIINWTPINTLLNIIVLIRVRQEDVLNKLHVLLNQMKLKVPPSFSSITLGNLNTYEKCQHV